MSHGALRSETFLLQPSPGTTSSAPPPHHHCTIPRSKHPAVHLCTEHNPWLPHKNSLMYKGSGPTPPVTACRAGTTVASSSSPAPAKKGKFTADVVIFDPKITGASAYGKRMCMRKNCALEDKRLEFVTSASHH